MIEIPGYTLSRQLGKGGMGTVYLATQRSLNREVAIKVLSPEVVALDPTTKERFLREARIAANLHHRHIGAVHDVVELDGTAYIAMEFVPGGSVARDSNPPIGATEVLKVVREVASALDYAHANGVVHRDIKPENILRRRDGSCVLSDFGIARAIEPETKTNTSLTGEGGVIGTPHYMSPEQLRGEKVDGRTDLYSLGVAMYQMLTGQLPYTGSDTWAIGIAHMTAPIPRLPAEYAALQPLLDSMLAKAPEDRPQSGAELVARVDELLGADAPRPEQMPVDVLKQPLRPLHALAVALVALAVIGIGSWLNPWKQRGGSENIAALTAAAVSNVPRIAVLPLDSLGADAEHAYFADGLHDEMLTALSKLSGLQVISRTTMKIYRNTTKPPKAVAGELHASHVLSGSVRQAGDTVRVTLELVDANGEQVWTQSYDRKLSNALQLQGEVAEEVARALKARVLPAEKAALAERDTDDATANEYYVKARLALEPAESERLLDLALERDPGFIAARAERARVHLMRYWGFQDATPERLAKARLDVEALQKIAPASSHTEFALACYDYYARLDYDAALARAEKLVAAFPGRADLQVLLGALYRTRGRFAEASEHLERALELDPLNVGKRMEWISHLVGLREYKRALAAIDVLAKIDPDNYQFKRIHAEVVYYAGGGTDGLETILAQYGARMQTQERRDLEVLLAEIHGDVPAIIKELETPREPTPNTMREMMPESARRQTAAWLKHDTATAQILLDESLAYFAQGPDRYPARSLPKLQMAFVSALAGDHDGTVRLVDEALAGQPIEGEAVEGAAILLPAAVPLAMVGEQARSIDLIERSLKLPFGAHAPQVVNAQFFRLTLDGNPRFDALKAKLRAAPPAL